MKLAIMTLAILSCSGCAVTRPIRAVVHDIRANKCQPEVEQCITDQNSDISWSPLGQR